MRHKGITVRHCLYGGGIFLFVLVVLLSVKDPILKSECDVHYPLKIHEYVKLAYTTDSGDHLTLKRSRRLIAFMHVAVMGTYTERFKTIMSAVSKSGLLDALEKFYVIVVGGAEGVLDIPTNSKISVKYLEHEDIGTYERHTITELHKFARDNPGTYILYLQNKGSSYSLDNLKINSWVDYLLFFNVEHWRDIPELLDKYPVVCADFTVANRRGGPGPHCSGNFWWARADYVSLLNVIPHYHGLCLEKYEWEFFIGNNIPHDTKGENSLVQACSLYHSQTDFYARSLPREKYSNITKVSCATLYPN